MIRMPFHQHGCGGLKKLNLCSKDSLTKLTLAQIHYKNMTPLKCHPPYIKDCVKIPRNTAKRLWSSTFHS